MFPSQIIEASLILLGLVQFYVPVLAFVFPGGNSQLPLRRRAIRKAMFLAFPAVILFLVSIGLAGYSQGIAVYTFLAGATYFAFFYLVIPIRFTATDFIQ
jgi:hypothetical protein